MARSRRWLGVVVTAEQLVADIARGYDVVIMGADKWAQLHDPGFYESEAARDDALARLPEVAIAARPPARLTNLGAGVVVLQLPSHLAEVSSTGVREGRADWSAT